MNNLPLLPLEQWIVYKAELKLNGALTELSIILPENVRNFRIKDGPRHIGIFLYWDQQRFLKGNPKTFKFWIVWTGYQFQVPSGHTLEFLASTWDRNEMFHVYLLNPLSDAPESL